MAKRKPMKIYPTMKLKIKDGEENAMPYEELQVVIEEVKDIETAAFGLKTVAVVKDNNSDRVFNVFLNNYSISALCEAFGEEDQKWIGEVCNIKKEVDKTYNSDMIVLVPAE